MMNSSPVEDSIVVASAACRLPGGVTDLSSLYKVLADGTCTVTGVPADRWDETVHDPSRRRGGTTSSHRGAFIEDVRAFDAEFFGISEQEASAMDPQQRLLLEVAWEAMRQVDARRESWADSRTGVYVGLLASDYRSLHLQRGDFDAIGAHYAPGNEASFAAGRIAYSFDLVGPAIGVSTACSSSLVALCLAADAIRLGKIDTAVVAGANLLLSPELSVYMSRIGALSPSGSCRPFDRNADGVVRGDGVAAVVLTRGGTIPDPLAVLRAYGTGHDGRSAGLTAPNAVAQTRLLREVWSSGSVDAAKIDFVEMHGTGTPLGDPIEVSALASAIEASGGREHPVYIGAHKANFGHLDAAAGLVGLLKAILVIRTRTILPQPTRQGAIEPIALPDSISLALDRQVLRPDGSPVVAAVNAFGLSGTNAHVVLESPPAAPASGPAPGPTLVSARDSESLTALTNRLCDRFDAGSDDHAWVAQGTRAIPHAMHRCALLRNDRGRLEPIATGVASRRRAVVAVALAYGSIPDRATLDQLRTMEHWKQVAAVCTRSTEVDLEQAFFEPDRSEFAQRLLVIAATYVRLFHLTDIGLSVDAFVGEGWLAPLGAHDEGALVAAITQAKDALPPGLTVEINANADWADAELSDLITSTSRRGAGALVSLASADVLGELTDICTDQGVHVRIVDARHAVPDGGDDLSARLTTSLDRCADPLVVDLSFTHTQPLHPETIWLPAGPSWSDRMAADAWTRGAEIRIRNPRRSSKPGGEVLPPMPWAHREFWAEALAPAAQPAPSDPPVPPTPATPNPRPHAAVTPAVDDDSVDSVDMTAAVDDALMKALGLGDDADLPAPTQPLFEAGLTSLDAVAMTESLSRRLGVDLPTTLVLENPSRAALVTALRESLESAPAIAPAAPASAPPAGQSTALPSASSSAQSTPDSVAIVGHSFVLPAAETDDQLWERLTCGEALASSRPAGRRWLGEEAAPGIPPATYLPAVDTFDHQFFGISPLEARWIDPQHRLILECTFQAMVNAGVELALPQVRTGVGVFVALDSTDYGQFAAHVDGAGSEYYGTGNSPSAASGRVSYSFDLGGPSMTVDTACSSSLAAFHLAKQSLLDGDCDYAIVAGANLMLSPTIPQSMGRAGALSTDGRCKTFDDSADGYGRGDGVIAFVLRRTREATEAGDRIEAIVAGSAVAHDARAGGFTVPSAAAQERVLRAALSDADSAPADVAAIEAHGTGTALGDPLELRALSATFGDHPVDVGSAKSIFGHLEAAAGLLGLLKVVLSLRHKTFPKQHVNTPTTKFEWSDHQIRIAPGSPLDERALVGVSSFGFTGTNAHVLLRAPSAIEPAHAVPRRWILPISAHSADACREWLMLLAKASRDWSTQSLTGVLSLLCRPARSLRYRTVVRADDAQDLLDALGRVADGAQEPDIVTVEPTAQTIDLDDIEDDRDPAAQFLAGAGLSWRAGCAIGAPSLPRYPFADRTHWLKPTTTAAAEAPAPSHQPEQVAAPRSAPQPKPKPPATGRTVSASSADRRRDTTARYLISIAKVFEEILEIPASDLDPNLGLFDLGVDSIQVVQICESLSNEHGVHLEAAATFEHSTVARLARHLAQLVRESAPDADAPSPTTAEHQAVERTPQTGGLSALEAAMYRANSLLAKEPVP